MACAKQLANRFREVLFTGTLIANTNYKQELTDVSYAIAFTKIANLNTIGLLTFHINYYIAGVLQVLEGGTLDIKDRYSFDMPPTTSPEAWQQLVNDLFTNAERFAILVEQLSDKQLNSFFVKETYGTYARNIEVMVEHCYYHLGQIVLIKKLINDYTD